MWNRLSQLPYTRGGAVNEGALNCDSPALASRSMGGTPFCPAVPAGQIWEP